MISHRTLLVVFSMLATPLFAESNYPPELPGSEAHTYKSVGDVKLQMWVYTPENHKPGNGERPAIVFFFGGGWKTGTPAQFETHCRYLASRGIVAATADYRVASRHGIKADSCVEDAKSAVRWLRANSEKLGIDPNRIAAAGGSAGGHTACCTGLIEGFEPAGEDTSVSSVPNAMALFNPAVMIAPLEAFGDSNVAEEKFADIATRTGVPAEHISPIHHVRSGLPPSIIFHGVDDPTVPFATVAEFARRMAAAGNQCELKGFAAAGHGFFNAPRSKDTKKADLSKQWHARTLLQLDSFLHSLGWVDGHPGIRVVDRDFVSLRGSVTNSLYQFETRKTGHVAFIGGSITEMNGYRPRIADWLQKRFPETNFTFTNAGISSTCSHTGAFRLKRDVLSQGPVDLLLVEFAVNDDQDASHSQDDCILGMEGIVRQVRQHNPIADIVMTHFVNPGMLETLNSGETILSASQHERVARHYGVSSVYLSKVVNRLINRNEMTWKQFGGTHPKPPGNQLAADMVTAILTAGWSGVAPETVAPTSHLMPKVRLSEASFEHGRLIPLDTISNTDGWQISEPDWANIPGGKRGRYLSRPLLHSTSPGMEQHFSFHGNAVGAFVVAGPDAGQLEVRIDDGGWRTVELYHRFSKGLHYPRTVMFGTGLTYAQHSVTMRVASTHHPDSKGTAVRILNLTINGESN